MSERKCEAPVDPYVAMISALARCTFLPASWDKRFVGAMCQRPPDKMTEPHRATILRLIHRYRRQISTEIIILAQDYGEFRARASTERNEG